MISTGTWLIICILLIIIEYAILKPIEDARAYKMYALRDELACNASKKNINQKSKEYIYLMTLINYKIYSSINNLDFSSLLKELISKTTDGFDHDAIMKNIEDDKILNHIYVECSYWFMKNMKLRIFFFINIALKPIYWMFRITYSILSSILAIFNFGDKLLSNIRRGMNFTEDLKDEYKQFSRF